ncbi:phosphoserine phosphatase SerB [Tessaracoccus antarcticus]|uniref:phosphoserine phosphatase n=1 Tax=Tessaracoccus antarcticus TaxID=2479848 RepID=A0A3M0GAC9_9ACTN|nr:phosphoserine phosphatase SerB [Tessaracoccus antarcticus]RMB61864.1 phosphoserine phosphatase SerB [Tessaracoccus antarcticus]
MQIRVVLVSPAPISDDLVALASQPGEPRMLGTDYGHVISVLREHDDPDTLRQQLRDTAGQDVAVAVITGPLATSPAGLILLDVDSTFTTTEAVDLLAEYAGAGERVAEITERAMRGEMDFTASLRERVATLAGLPTSVLDEVGPRMTLAPGAEALVAAAQAAGVRVGVTSGGFTQLVGPMAQRHGLDFSNANELGTHVVDGVEYLTGTVVGPIVDRDQKARDLVRFAAAHGVDPDLTVAVGDGANDLAMLSAAGLGVAYCAKPLTARQADVAITFPRLDAVAAFALLR